MTQASIRSPLENGQENGHPLSTNYGKNPGRLGLVTAVLLGTSDFAFGQDYLVDGCYFTDNNSMQCFEDSSGTQQLFYSRQQMLEWTNDTLPYRIPTIPLTYATKEEMYEYVNSKLSYAPEDVLDVVDSETAIKFFTFGFFSVFTIWLFGYGIGMIRRLLIYLSI